VAAEYIAAQFRRLGLKPAGNEGYFQTAAYQRVTQNLDGFVLTIRSGAATYQAPKDRVMVNTAAALALKDAPVVVLDLTTAGSPLPAREAVAGKVVVLRLGELRGRAAMEKREAVAKLAPALLVTNGFVMRQRGLLREAAAAPVAPTVIISDSDYDTLAAGLKADARLDAALPAPQIEPVALKNIIAVLPGSDTKLKDTFVLLTAHYDHIGVRPSGTGDRINNGANDDASGVATVLALAEAFARSPQKPRRTLVFMTYFGEEKGLLGSRYYAAHPVFPLRDTVANLNFEHMGRTDDSEGSRVGRITSTGFTYTTLEKGLKDAAGAAGLEAWTDEKKSDGFFGSSDNRPLAGAGVPAITLAVAWIFPDYHNVGDEWEKLDYSNMEKAVRACGVLAWRVADAKDEVRWNVSNPKTAEFVKAWQALHAAK
jgi:hypothetical protein